MKKILLAIPLLLICSLLWAQPNIHFFETEHDFGKIRESDGAAEHSFYFTNIGNEPLKINRVQASCGCTTPGWSEEPVQPGDTGFVKASFNARNRPGQFSKTLSVYINTEQGVEILKIKGFVIPEALEGSAELPHQVGALRFSDLEIDLGEMAKGDSGMYTITVFNISEKNIMFDPEISMPEFMDIDFIHSQVAPGKKGYVKLNFDTEKVQAYGHQVFRVNLKTDEEENNLKPITIKVKIMPEKSQISEADLKKVPKVVADVAVVDLGKVKMGDVIGHTFYLENQGQKELEVFKVESLPTYIQIEEAPQKIKAGKKEKVVVVYNSSGKIGKDAKFISIYTNDPNQPELKIGLKVEIEKS